MNHKIIELKKGNTEKIIKMGSMRSGQTGIIAEGTYNGNYVLRTFSTSQFEVINLSRPKKDSCWTNDSCPLKVRLLNPDESVVVEFMN